MAEGDGNPSLLVVLRLLDLLTGPLSAARVKVEQFGTTLGTKLTPPLKGAAAAQKDLGSSATAAAGAVTAEARAAEGLAATVAGTLEPALARSTVAEQALAGAAVAAGGAVAGTTAGFTAGAGAAALYGARVGQASLAVAGFRSQLALLNATAAARGASPAGGTALIGPAAQGQVLLATATRDATGAIGEQERQMAASGGLAALFAGRIGAVALQYGRMASAIGVASVTLQSFNRSKEFEQTFSRIPVLLDLTAEQADALRESLSKLSVETAIAKPELAAGFFKALQEGAKGADEAMQVVTLGAKLQTAGFGTLQQGIEAVMNTLDAYGDGLERAQHVADVLVATNKATGDSFETLSAKFDDVAPLAATAGISVDRLASAYIRLDRAGIDVAKRTQLIRTAIENPGDTAALEKLTARGVDLKTLFDELPEVASAAGAANLAFEESTKGSVFQLDRLRTTITEVVDSRVGGELLKFLGTLAKTANDTIEPLGRLVSTLEGLTGLDLSKVPLSGLAAFNRLGDAVDAVAKKYPQTAGAGDTLRRSMFGLLGVTADLVDKFGEVEKAQPKLESGTSLGGFLQAIEAKNRDAAAALEAAKANREAANAGREWVASQERMKAVLPGIASSIAAITTEILAFQSQVATAAATQRVEEVYRGIATGTDAARAALEQKLEADLREIEAIEQLAGRSYPLLRAAVSEYHDEQLAVVEAQAKQREELAQTELHARLAEQAYARLGNTLATVAIFVGRMTQNVANLQIEQEKTFGGGFQKTIDQYVARIRDASEQGREFAAGVLGGFENGLDAFLRSLGTGQNAFKNFTTTLLGEWQRMLSRMLARQLTAALFGSLFGGAGGFAGLFAERGGVYSFASGGVASLTGNAGVKVKSFASGGMEALTRGGVTSQPTMFHVAERQGMSEAFVPLPGPNRGIPVEFTKGAGGSRAVTFNLVVQSLDPRTAADAVLAQMPKIQRALTYALHTRMDGTFNDAVRGAVTG